MSCCSITSKWELQELLNIEMAVASKRLQGGDIRQVLTFFLISAWGSHAICLLMLCAKHMFLSLLFKCISACIDNNRGCCLVRDFSGAGRQPCPLANKASSDFWVLFEESRFSQDKEKLNC